MKGRAWTKDEEDILRAEYALHHGTLGFVPALAAKLGRSETATVMKAHKLGLSKPENTKLTGEMYLQTVAGEGAELGMTAGQALLALMKRGPSTIRRRVWSQLKADGVAIKAIAGISGFDQKTIWESVR